MTLATEPAVKHGGFYWTLFHLKQDLLAFFRRHLRKFLYILAVFITCLFIFRPVVQPAVITLLNHGLFIFIWALLLGFSGWLMFGKSRWHWRTVRSIVAAALLVSWGLWGNQVYYLGNLYARHETINIVTLKKSGLTGHERIQPYVTVDTDIHQKISGGQEATKPNLVRIGDSYVWTTLIGPGYWTGKAFGGEISTVKVISATEQNPVWVDRPVRFSIGEQMYLSHDIHTCVVRGFGPLQYLRYEPAEVKAMERDGKMVQVVSLKKWDWLNYQLRFGGVVVINEDDLTFSWDPSVIATIAWHWLKLVTTGCGEWIPPEEVARHAFLKGQNVVPEAVGRFVAESFRFQGGWWDPTWGFHIHDIRIPSLAEDGNEQPIVQYLYDIPGEEGKLYQTYSLEPYNADKQGFSLAVMLPGDDDSKVYVYEPVGLTGISAIADKVKPTNPLIDWNNSFPAEKRWFIRDINGQRLFFIYTSVVTKGSRAGRANAGVSSDIPVTDPRGSTRTYWMKEAKPDVWAKQLELTLKPAAQ